MSTAAMVHARFDSPIGLLTLCGSDGILSGLYMDPHQNGPEAARLGPRDDAAFKSVREQLAAYFSGELRVFDLRLEVLGTVFQKKVWAALCEIPYGETISYGELARRIGQPTAARAVGLANGQNPVSIIVPCHRVLGADCKMGGFSANGGVATKRRMLEIEGAPEVGAGPLFAQR